MLFIKMYQKYFGNYKNNQINSYINYFYIYLKHTRDFNGDLLGKVA